MDDEDITKWDMVKLNRKRDQAWELAGLARKDGDHADEEVQMSMARMYTAQIKKRRHT